MPNDNVYNLLLLVHIVAVVVTFAPAAINPLLERHFEKNGGEAALINWAGFSAFYTSRISLGGLVVLLLTGVAMILEFDGWEFSQTWISLSFLVWFAIGGVVSAIILKGEKQVAAGDMGGRALLAKGGPIATVLLLVMLYLMVFKPGL
ncbi:MAG: hypothetical protein ACSLFO_07180 [Acidimicrobiales bacterium]